MERTEGGSGRGEALEGSLLDVTSASFVKFKADAHVVGGCLSLVHRDECEIGGKEGDVGGSECERVASKVARVVGERDFAELVRFVSGIASAVFTTPGASLEAKAYCIKDTGRFGHEASSSGGGEESMEDGSGERESFISSLTPLLHVSEELVKCWEVARSVSWKACGCVAIPRVRETIVYGMRCCSK